MKDLASGSGRRSRLSMRRGYRKDKRRKRSTYPGGQLDHIKPGRSLSLGRRFAAHYSDSNRGACAVCGSVCLAIEPALIRCAVCGNRRWSRATLTQLWRQWRIDAQVSSLAAMADGGSPFQGGGRRDPGNNLLDEIDPPPWFRWYALGKDRGDLFESFEVAAASA